MANWTEERIRQLIQDKVEENLQLEYKGARALGRQNDKTVEITKDVSAMANSIGGTLIYGVSEYNESEKCHLPEKLEPIDRTQFSREWLEQIIGTIQPRIESLVIHALNDETRKGYGFYVIEIPQSSTAHQAKDFKYYKRLNFSVAPMEDYEVRDVMNRRKHPHVVLSFELHRYTPQDSMRMPAILRHRDEEKEGLSLHVFGCNDGGVFAQYVVAKLEIPTGLIHPMVVIRSEIPDLNNLPDSITQTITNQTHDTGPLGNRISDVRFEPLLPELTVYLGSVSMSLDALITSRGDSVIEWRTHADNGVPVRGAVSLKDIPVIDNRDKS
jgi:Putative DNA-binding domain